MILSKWVGMILLPKLSGKGGQVNTLAEVTEIPGWTIYFITWDNFKNYQGIKSVFSGKSLTVQWLGLSTSIAGARVQSWSGNKIPQATQHSQKKIKHIFKRKIFLFVEVFLLLTHVR